MKALRNGILLVLFLIMVFPLHALGTPMKLSKHNLSVSGPGDIKSNTESRICIFCHISHGARQGMGTSAPLWNREEPKTLYTPYSSTTINYTPMQPTGSSRLCLSCHDGTIALGDTFRKPIDDMKHQFLTEDADGYVGTDLSDEHPVSLPYNATQNRNKKLRHSSMFSKVKLENGQLQCVSCHNVHDNSYGDFLINTDLESTLCLECHDDPGWSDGIHNVSVRTWNGKGEKPWKDNKYNTVRANGCRNCHNVHKAKGRQRLLKHLDEDEVCLSCHDGGTGSDIKRLFNKNVKIYTHSTDSGYSESHDPIEDYEGSVKPHVKCVDCHNAHVSGSDKTPNAPRVNATTKGVKGITASGRSTSSANYMFEICFKCHGDKANNVAPTRSTHKEREYESWNTRQDFNPSNASSHPVQGPMKNISPSLKPNITHTTNYIYCHDCHNNDDVGPNKLSGPHGSNNEWMLEKEYIVYDPNPYTSSAYALCYKCHNESSVLSNESFPLHSKHIVDESAPCSVCHDPHGVGRKISGDSTHLINFDLEAVRTSGGRLFFKDDGINRGSCVLTCHGVNHNLGDNGEPEFKYGYGSHETSSRGF